MQRGGVSNCFWILFLFHPWNAGPEVILTNLSHCGEHEARRLPEQHFWGSFHPIFPHPPGWRWEKYSGRYYSVIVGNFVTVSYLLYHLFQCAWWTIVSHQSGKSSLPFQKQGSSPATWSLQWPSRSLQGPPNSLLGHIGVAAFLTMEGCSL